MTTKIKEYLYNLPFFNSLSPEELLFLSDYLDERQFVAGDVILHQGEQGGDLYLIRSGSVSVCITLPGDRKAIATKLYANQVFGEVAFLATAPVTASVVSDSSCECLILTQKVLLMLRVAAPETAYKIEKAIAYQTAEKIIANIDNINELLRKIPKKFQVQSEHARYLPDVSAHYKSLMLDTLELSHIGKLNFCQKLDTEQLKFLLPYFTIRHYDKGYQFLTHTNETRKFALIYSGAVMLFIMKEQKLKKSIAVSGVGDLFMQRFFFPEFNHAANYVTCEPSILLELEFETYERLHKLHAPIFYIISQFIHQTVAKSVYIINRQLIRINSELDDLIK